MKPVKYILALLLILFSILLLKIPGLKDLKNSEGALLSEYNEIDDYDYRSLAKTLWEKDQQEQALAALNIIIQQNLPDKAAAEQLHKQYLEEINKRNSGLGKLTAFGAAFVSGNVNSFEELAGSSLADFFVYGDLRDITKELLINDQSDKLIVTLSSIGLLTTLFPPADPMASMMKAAYKSNSLTADMISRLRTILAPLGKGVTKISTTQLKNILSHLKPIWEMAGKCKSWQQFSLFLKQCKNIKQVKFINKIISTSGNSQKLSSLLTCLKSFPSRSAKALDFIKNYGQKGMDSLYSLLRKGPNGLQFLLKNPKLYAKIAKNSVKATGLISSKVMQQWKDFLTKHGTAAEVGRYAASLFSLLLALFLLVGKRRKHSAPNTTSEAIGLSPTQSKSSFYKKIFYAASIFLFIFLVSNISAGGSSELSLGPQAKSNGFSFSSIFFFLIFSAVQIWAVMKTRKEIEDIKAVPNKSAKLALLENSEFYFDLPVYTGLAGTVCAFILLNFDPSGSRTLAYLTTISGIIISVALKGSLLFPLKKALLEEPIK